jgi:type VI secretion system protein ImpG
MNDELLRYYNKELAFIRNMGAEFAENYPKLAGRLKLSEEHVEDPHVSRLIEAFSLLTAQVRQKLDDSFPELTDALLGQLYPDYQAPIPSMSVIKMVTENVSTSGLVLPRGAKVETQVEGIKPCYFQTCYETTLWPLEITDAKFQNAPFSAPQPIWQTPPKSIIKLSFCTDFEEVSMANLAVDNLRFYLHGQPQQSFLLYELLSAHCIGMAISRPGDFTGAQYLESRHIKALGFEEEQQVVPYSKRSFSAYRTLIENFIFPEKFMFFELNKLNTNWPNIDNKFDLYIYIDQISDDLEKQVTLNNFLMGCTPIINLFKQELEPVHIEASQYEYKLAAKYMDADVSEIIQIQNVEAYDQKQNMLKVTPFYAETHPAYTDQDRMFWHGRRESSSWAGGSAENGSELYLSLVDHQFKGFSCTDEYNTWVLRISALCSNRNLPIHLPFGSDQAKMLVSDHADIIKQVKCLLAPTTPVRAALGDATRWQLISHLSLDHFSGESAIKTLKDTLKLYDFKSSPENKTLIENIVGIKLQSATARVNQKGRICFCNGTEIELTFATDNFAGSGVFFFSAILDYFFSQFASINSFTRLSIKFNGQDNVYHQWPSRAGSIELL